MKATIAVIALVVLAALVAAGAARPVAIPGRSAPAYATCQEEDGSTPGQAFPCYWDGRTMGNGAGQSYLLAEPIDCSYDPAYCGDAS